MKSSEAHNLKDDELLEQIKQSREEQFALRRDIARLLTVAKERGIDLETELRA